ncbi:neuronal regeneration-related protein isoform X3 [Cebus imitator]|uniref:Neuronal regeneration-related protein n=1 Tax=Sapajus apella TaxID=9515 RepID=A0A6J3HLA3_SAPAP|nr:neuronal regeneration-related protein isoform X3 [Cebus imitator]XP_032130409.1 neuronal regeneration-related protein isoform X3 [Sapajus apella]
MEVEALVEYQKSGLNHLRAKVHYPELLVWVNQEPFPNKEMEGRLPKGRLPVPKEVNWKKDDETNAASLPPLGSNELRSPRISYLHFF